MLQDGAHVFAVQNILGHRSLGMRKRYVALAESDITAAYRTVSPADNLR